MASRRLRIKAVANLPVRRARGSDQASSLISNGNTSISKDPEPLKSEANVPIASQVQNVEASSENNETSERTSKSHLSNGQDVDIINKVPNSFTKSNSISPKSCVNRINNADESKSIGIDRTSNNQRLQELNNSTINIEDESNKSSTKDVVSEDISAIGTAETGCTKDVVSEDISAVGTAETGCIKDVVSEDISAVGTAETGCTKDVVSEDISAVGTAVIGCIVENPASSATSSTDAHHIKNEARLRESSQVGEDNIGNKTQECETSGKNVATPVPNPSQIAARFGRKRMKPTVSLSAASRRPRENKESNECSVKSEKLDQASDSNPDANNDKNKLDRLGDLKEGVHTVQEDITNKSEVFPNVSGISSLSNLVKHDVDKKNEKYKQRINIRGITRLIPTGTSIRPLENNVSVGTPSSTSVAREADVPSKEASGDAPVREVDVWSQLGRFQEGDAKSQCGDSESGSRKCASIASTITPPIQAKLKSVNSEFHHPNVVVKRRKSAASESDDDTRKSFSAISTVSYQASTVDTDSDIDSMVSESFQRRSLCGRFRMRRKQETSIRLVEAKRQFAAKFGSSTPEKSRLTMFDLIFYNPTTNPMKSSSEKPTDAQESAVSVPANELVEEQLAEEGVDNPDGQDAAGQQVEEEDESFSMPVPQVKVGADGQIIIDEQSLVIETTGSQKSREDLANSAAVLDLGTGSYNAYSKTKTKRSRDWSETETLKFYKALQTVGTDFLLMQTIFPKRSRAELKTKYKKEEKMNPHLIEKALSNPLPFDLTELQNEVENAELQEKREREEKMRMKKMYRKSQSRRGALSQSLDKQDSGAIRNKRTNGPRKNKEPVNKKPKLMKGRRKRQKHKSDPVSSEEDEDEYDDIQSGVDAFNGKDKAAGKEISEVENKSSSDSETDEMKFLSRSPHPTRSGRLTKPRILPEITESDDPSWGEFETVQTSTVASSSTVICRESLGPPFEGIANNFKNIEPGSLVVLTTESPDNPGHQIVNVFMVSRGSNLHAGLGSESIAVSPETLQIVSNVVEQIVQDGDSNEVTNSC